MYEISCCCGEKYYTEKCNFDCFFNGFEAWTLIMGEEHTRRLTVSENMVMRKILGSKKRQQGNGEDHVMRSFMICTLHQILFGVIKSRRMRWAGNVARMRDRRGAYRVLVGIPDGNMPLGRPRHRCEDNIKMVLQEVGWGGVDWIALAEDGNRRRPSGSIQCRELRH
jgi:hypothetical protein